MKKARWIAIVITVLLGIYLFSHRDTLLNRSSKETPSPVSVASVHQETVTETQSTIGEVQSYSTVNISPQVSGQIQDIQFQEGSLVKKNQVLFLIDPRPYQAALDQANATLAHDEAQLWSTTQLVQRQNALLKKGFIAKQDFDSSNANAKSLEAQVNSDKAAIKNAELNLSYCTITSPINGRSGNILVNAGNNVVANSSTPLVTLNQIQPIYVSFSIPEHALFNVQKEQQKNPVIITVKTDHRTEEGKLTFINNTVDSTTGTIQLKATFQNKDLQLWPGQYVQVTVPIESIDNALTVPAEAVQLGQQGYYVYKLTSKNTVAYQTVTIGPTLSQKIVIKTGLTPSDKVVIKGMLRIKDKSPVQVIPSS